MICNKLKNLFIHARKQAKPIFSIISHCNWVMATHIWNSFDCLYRKLEIRAQSEWNEWKMTDEIEYSCLSQLLISFRSWEVKTILFSIDGAGWFFWFATENACKAYKYQIFNRITESDSWTSLIIYNWNKYEIIAAILFFFKCMKSHSKIGWLSLWKSVLFFRLPRRRTFIQVQFL